MKNLTSEIQDDIKKHLPSKAFDMLQERLQELIVSESLLETYKFTIEQGTKQNDELIDVREDLTEQIKQFKIREKDVIAKEKKVNAMIEENNIEHIKLTMELTHCAEKVNLMREIIGVVGGNK